MRGGVEGTDTLSAAYYAQAGGGCLGGGTGARGEAGGRTGSQGAQQTPPALRCVGWL